MRRSPSPLRALSSPSADFGVDVMGRPKLRSAFLPHVSQDIEFPSASLGQFVGSIYAREWGSPTSRLVGDASWTGAAPQPFSEEEKI